MHVDGLKNEMLSLLKNMEARRRLKDSLVRNLKRIVPWLKAKYCCYQQEVSKEVMLQKSQYFVQMGEAQSN